MLKIVDMMDDFMDRFEQCRGEIDAMFDVEWAPVVDGDAVQRACRVNDVHSYAVGQKFRLTRIVISGSRVSNLIGIMLYLKFAHNREVTYFICSSGLDDDTQMLTGRFDDRSFCGTLLEIIRSINPDTGLTVDDLCSAAD